MQLAQTFKIYQEEMKRVADLGILRSAADFPTVLKKWKSSQQRFIERGGAVEYKDPSRENIFQNPATAHYREQNFEPWSNSGVTTDMTVELARFNVAVGSSGIVRKLFQWVEGYTDFFHWGNPVTNNMVVDGIIWHLRLTPFRGLIEPQLISPNDWLPGQPYPDLPFFRYLWFMPHAAGHDVNLIVPGGYSLRLIARIPAPDEETFQVMARMVGYWQSSEYPVESGFNVKKGF